jgi:hypothetical protein
MISGRKEHYQCLCGGNLSQIHPNSNLCRCTNCKGLQQAPQINFEPMIGRTYRTPGQPSGLVRVVAIDRALCEGSVTVQVVFAEEYNGYSAGSTGSYFAEELQEAG